MEINAALAGVNHFASQFDTANNNVDNARESSTQGFAAFAQQPGVMNTILNGKSLMTTNGSVIPSLAVPVQLGERFSSEQLQNIVAMSSNINTNDALILELVASSASDVMNAQLKETAQAATQVAAPLQDANANKLERMAATAASQFANPAASAQVNSKAGENTKSATEATVTNSVSSANPTRSQAAVEGGTDITAADETNFVFSKIMGDTRILDLHNTLTRVLNKAEAEFNKTQAQASIRAVESAAHAGNKMIDSAKQNMTGAIAGGVLSMAVQGGSTISQVKAFRNESKSIDTNLKSANNLDLGRSQNQSAIKAGSDNMLSKGDQIDGNVEGLMQQPHIKSQIESSNFRDAHTNKQLDTQKARAVGDLATTGGRSAQSMVEGAYGVNAAEENKQAEQARANQATENEVGNMHQQAAKKTAESEAALQRVLENVLSTNNNTVSSVAEHIR